MPTPRKPLRNTYPNRHRRAVRSLTNARLRELEIRAAMLGCLWIMGLVIAAIALTPIPA